jgi:hypothetical protein
MLGPRAGGARVVGDDSGSRTLQKSWSPEEMLEKYQAAEKMLSAPGINPQVLKDDPAFRLGVDLQALFIRARNACELDRRFGLECDRAIPVERLRTIADRLPPRRDFDEAEMNLSQWSPLSNVAGLKLLFRYPLIQTEIDPKTDGTEVSLYLRFRRGKGFPSDHEWEETFSILKSAGEKFWRGTLESSEIGRAMIRLKVLESDGPNAVTVDRKQLFVADAGVSMLDATLYVGPAATYGSPGRIESVFAHEIGHLLGFLDNYRYFTDVATCKIGVNFTAEDIMTSHPEAKITQRELDLLYRAYVKEPSDNDNEMIVPILTWERGS